MAFLAEELVGLVREVLLVDHVAQVLDVCKQLLHLLARLSARPRPALRGETPADLAAELTQTLLLIPICRLVEGTITGHGSLLTALHYGLRLVMAQRRVQRGLAINTLESRDKLTRGRPPDGPLPYLASATPWRCHVGNNLLQRVAHETVRASSLQLLLVTGLAAEGA